MFTLERLPRRLDSKIWTHMLKGREEIDKYLIWELGKGEINFWKDNWCPANQLEPLQNGKDEELLVKDCWNGNEWFEDALKKILKDSAARNDILKLKGLKGPSRCHIFNNNQESSDHLFFWCNFAMEVWNKLNSNSNLNLLNVGWGNLKDSLRDWQEINLMPLPFIVAWFIWNARNKVKHEDSVSPSDSMATNCQSYLHKLINWKKFPQILKYMTNIDFKHSIVIKVRWEKPPHPFIKIKTDGNFTNKRAGIGGIFRDHTGKVLLYFKAPYIAEDALKTEAVALHWALKFAKEVKWNCIIAEVDSSHLVELVTATPSPLGT
ncbi:uncharacterized protein LOC110036789 [Phalaenopsis equestris]|uniref:uncharacterized protein LOC110036789 n=1 Tax=Phalaenopsis equestris TaxID=78828 RepID=UPI0009E20C8B|nr:uncharacterized protein LOC110036789 [Phalaenopsis equestris]